MSRLSYLAPTVRVQPSPIQGRGLFAAAPIAAGEVVAVKGGYVFDRETLRRVERRLGPAEIQIGADLFIGPLVEEEREGSMIFSNHSCDPNIGVRGQIVFVALRAIEPGEELTHDWATTDDDDYEMACRCGSPRCRGTITGRDWQRPELQQRYRGQFAWHLEQRIRSAARPAQAYMYAWEYRVAEDARAAFRRAYGPEGEWVELFRQAPGYRETQLHQDRLDPARFVTIDVWDSEEAWQSFRTGRATEFEALDARCERLTLEEREIGCFRPVG